MYLMCETKGNETFYYLINVSSMSRCSLEIKTNPASLLVSKIYTNNADSVKPSNLFTLFNQKPNYHSEKKEEPKRVHFLVCRTDPFVAPFSLLFVRWSHFIKKKFENGA